MSEHSKGAEDADEAGDPKSTEDSDEAGDRIVGLFIELGAEGNEGDANEKDTDHLSLAWLTPRGQSLRSVSDPYLRLAASSPAEFDTSPLPPRPAAESAGQAAATAAATKTTTTTTAAAAAAATHATTWPEKTPSLLTMGTATGTGTPPRTDDGEAGGMTPRRGSYIAKRTTPSPVVTPAQSTLSGVVCFPEPYSFYNYTGDVFALERSRPAQLPLLLRMQHELAGQLQDPGLEAAIPLRTCYKYCLLRHTVLHELAVIDDVAGLEQLLDIYTVVASASNSNRIPLTFLRKRPSSLSKKQRRYTLRLLDVDWTNPFGETALWLAAGCSSRFFFRLLEAGATVPQTSCSLLHAATTLAATKGDLSVLKYLLDHTAIKPDTDNQFGESALHYAAGLGCTAAAQLLLSKGADINRRSFRLGLSPLVYAVKHRQSEVALLLIENDAKVTGRTARGLGNEALLHLAARRQASFEMMQRLVQLGCRIDKSTCLPCSSDDLAACCDAVPPTIARWIKLEVDAVGQKKKPEKRGIRKLFRAGGGSHARRSANSSSTEHAAATDLSDPEHGASDTDDDPELNSPLSMLEFLRSPVAPSLSSNALATPTPTSTAAASLPRAVSPPPRAVSAPEPLSSTSPHNDDDIVDLFDFLRTRPNASESAISGLRSPEHEDAGACSDDNQPAHNGEQVVDLFDILAEPRPKPPPKGKTRLTSLFRPKAQ